MSSCTTLRYAIETHVLRAEAAQRSGGAVRTLSADEQGQGKHRKYGEDAHVLWLVGL